MKTKCFVFLSQNYPKERINFDLINKDVNECFDDFVLYDESDLDDYIMNKIDEITTRFNTIQGYGFWVWRPYVLLKELESLEDGDVLVNFDAHLRLDKVKDNLQELIYDKLSPDNFMISANTGMPEYKYSTTKLISYIEQHLSHEYSESDISGFQYDAGILFMMKCEKTITFLKQWLDIMLNGIEYVSNEHNKDEDNHPEFVENRHDQSVFSLLYKYHKLNFYSNINWGVFHGL